MILIACTKCLSLTSLHREKRTCPCGAAWGIYTGPHDITVNGYAVPIGVANKSLREAINNRPTEGYGRHLEALVMPINAKGITVDHSGGVEAAQTAQLQEEEDVK